MRRYSIERYAPPPLLEIIIERWDQGPGTDSVVGQNVTSINVGDRVALEVSPSLLLRWGSADGNSQGRAAFDVTGANRVTVRRIPWAAGNDSG